MEKAVELIRQYVMAGFTKIHIDTSMRLGEDNRNNPLEPELVARRGAVLCLAAEEAFCEYKNINSNAIHPVYVIGSEVPIPGGSTGNEDIVEVTEASSFTETVQTFKGEYAKQNLEAAWEYVLAVVVQPGVEFGDDTIHEYNRKAASKLTKALDKYPGLVFEGHSTDYQTADCLRQMVEDGFAVLKVGPALTFALREALFALNCIENELFAGSQDVIVSNFMNILDTAMIKSPENWKKHYHGSNGSIRLARKYSFSDRCRYYMPVQEVEESIKLLIKNLKLADIPLTLLSQFMPMQYNKIRSGALKNDPESLIKDKIINVLDTYYFAT
jgi:D-tagatose-1,6-bisphosphate aldolase subunit GatZ/KbaZ